MTKEETLDWLYRLRSNIGIYMPREWNISMVNALDMAIKALEQEPPTKNDLAVDCINKAEFVQKLENETMGLQSWQKALLYQVMDDCHSVTPQEPFKPMVEIDLYSVIKQKYIEREVLDKIRAEIAEEINKDDHADEYCDGYYDGMRNALAIIDNYKAESENKK